MSVLSSILISHCHCHHVRGVLARRCPSLELYLLQGLEACDCHAAVDAHRRQYVRRNVREIQSEEGVERAHQVGVVAEVVAAPVGDHDYVRQT